MLDCGGDVTIANKNKETPLYYSTSDLARRFGLNHNGIYYGTIDTLRAGLKVTPKSNIMNRTKNYKPLKVKNKITSSIDI